MARWLPRFSPATVYSFLTGAAWGLDLNGLAAGNTKAGRALLEQYYGDDSRDRGRQVEVRELKKAA